MNTTIGERIWSLRKKAGLTQEQLAEAIGLKKDAISKYEKGRVINIKRDNLKKLAEALNSTPEFIMGYTETLHNVSISEEGSTETVDISFSPDSVLLSIDGESGDFTEMFMRLSKENKQMLLEEMLRYYCGVELG